jgi:hypothetical protein
VNRRRLVAAKTALLMVTTILPLGSSRSQPCGTVLDYHGDFCVDWAFNAYRLDLPGARTRVRLVPDGWGLLLDDRKQLRLVADGRGYAPGDGIRVQVVPNKKRAVDAIRRWNERVSTGQQSGDVMGTKIENPVFKTPDDEAEFVRVVLNTINQTRLEFVGEDRECSRGTATEKAGG